MINPAVDRLVASIVTWTNAQKSYVTKTKLLKLLYLFDVEYYRIHRRTFTGFTWKFFHLGPWAPEFDRLLQGMVEIEALTERRSSTDYEACFYRTKAPVDTRAAFTTMQDEAILRGVLIRWGEASTGEILNHVYFQTPPMEAATRNRPLDFSVIPAGAPLAYTRSSSGKPAAEVQKLRRQFEAERGQPAKQRPRFSFTPPRYDQEFREAVAKLETA